MKVQHVDALVEEVAVGLPKHRLSHQGMARGGRVSRSRRSANHSFYGQRGATRVIATRDDSRTQAITRPTRGKGGRTRKDPGRPKDGETHP